MSHPQSSAERNECISNPLLSCAQLNPSTPTQFKTLCLGDVAAHAGLYIPTPVKTVPTDMPSCLPDTDGSLSRFFPSDSKLGWVDSLSYSPWQILHTLEMVLSCSSYSRKVILMATVSINLGLPDGLLCSQAPLLLNPILHWKLTDLSSFPSSNGTAI